MVQSKSAHPSGERSVNNVGAVVSAADTDLEDRCIYALLEKDVEGKDSNISKVHGFVWCVGMSSL